MARVITKNPGESLTQAVERTMAEPVKYTAEGSVFGWRVLKDGATITTTITESEARRFAASEQLVEACKAFVDSRSSAGLASALCLAEAALAATRPPPARR